MTNHLYYCDNLRVLRDHIADGSVNPVPRIQIVTIEEAMRLRDRAVQLPLRRADVFRKAAREEDRSAQGALDL